ncbi:hypothetical protein QTH91_03535 [Variovorax dokdonensis]|uniref:Glycosyltransferase n=1 Tax=Variovorax dokdonensis TaxID=344883 RepID=A0ABT7N6H1_9BURK|nr:hypothetical protein [Variovorax dokdonensis]MDM0043543.1 hypothetical protein [Variovorax dokdonensis]
MNMVPTQEPTRIASTEVVSLIPPGRGGVRDYAEILGPHLQSRILAPTAATALAEFGRGDIVLNFSGYGYQSRGVPLWLVDRIRQLRQQGARIGIYFHELFTQSEPPWGSAFWLAPLQRRIARDLGQMAHYWLTSRDTSAQWLRRHCPPVPHRVLPVYSNVGELDGLPPSRSDDIVVFGGPHVRSLTYESLDDSFWDWVRVNGLKVHDIGPFADSAAFKRLRSAGQIEVHGSLPAPQVSKLLAQARFGLLNYAPEAAAKSGVFAAFCAHGVCTVLCADRYGTHDDLVPGTHYLAGTRALMREKADHDAIGRAAFDWYQPHRVAAHAQAFRELMDTST